MVVPNWFTCCEVLPEPPSLRAWVEAMTSLGRLIFFDQPGTGASDPVSPGALPTLEQWTDSIAAVLDDLGTRDAVLPGSGELQHVVNPDMPWNEEIRATWACMERLAASPRAVALLTRAGRLRWRP